MTQTRIILIVAALLGFLSVALGAFGAHGLKEHVSAERLTNWNTAVFYQLTHTLVLFGLMWLRVRAIEDGIGRGRWAAIAGWMMICGIIIFSGSLYVLVLTGVTKFGAVTPFGGTAMLIGWILIIPSAVMATRSKAKQTA